MKLEELQNLKYTPTHYPLKKMGVLVQTDDDEILVEMFDPSTFDTYIKKVLCDENGYVYHVYFRIGYVALFYFYNGEKSLRDIFLGCKSYFIGRNTIAQYAEKYVEMSDDFKGTVEEREAFADIWGPLKESFYNPKTYTSYANHQAEKLVKK